MKKILMIVLAALFFIAGFGSIAQAKEKTRFVFGWSHYVWWEPLAYMEYAKILEKHAKKNGIEIELKLVGDYPTSIDLYTTGQLDGVSITDMDALISPANSGVDTTLVVVGDFSNGNDGVVLANSHDCVDVKGRKFRIVQGSVSQYLLSKFLEKCGVSENDVVMVNTSDTDIVTVYAEDNDPRKAAVTWNPQLMQVRNLPNSTVVFDSSQIPGHIKDTLGVRTDSPDSFKRAITGAWYETMQRLALNSLEREKAIAFMAHYSGPTITVDDFKTQMGTTAIFYTAAEAVTFARSDKLKQIMEEVRSFCFTHGLFGSGTHSKDEVGILFPDGTVMGDPKNVKVRFDSRYMQLAAEGKI